MKNLFIGLLSLMFVFSGCDFINTKILKKKKGPTAEEVAKFKADSIRRADSLMMADLEQARLDSMAQAQAAALSQSVSTENAKYHVISGSFKTPEYADKYSELMVSKFGFSSTRIIDGPVDFKLVSVKQCESMNEAINAAKEVTSNESLQAWIYKAN